jgi:membrane-associated phospholipid phosphatase
MERKQSIVSIAAFALLGLVVSFFLDKGLALFVDGILRAYLGLSALTGNIPDLLFPLVCVITVVAWAAFFYGEKMGLKKIPSRFFLLAAIAVPLSYTMKTIGKLVVGRINTRYWLLHPDAGEFHWFRGCGEFNGFPSGHMAVFTVLACAVWTYFPRLRGVSAGFLAMLALALIATEHHFLSDVVAGFYLGLIVHLVVLRFTASPVVNREGLN